MLPKEGPRYVRQAIGLAVTAAEQIDQNLNREVFQIMLHRLRGSRVWLTGVLHYEVS
jgi:hypothetical protein